MVEGCRLEILNLLPNGRIDMNIFGHLVSWEPAKVVRLGNELQMMIDTAPEGVELFEVVVPADIIVHVRPDDMRELVNKIGGLMAYLGSQKMKAEREGFEP